MTMLTLDHVTKVYGAGHTAIRAVDDISMSVEQGEIVLIMGPSGSGKTTVLTMIGSLLRPTSGKVIIQGQDLASMPEATLPSFRLQEIGFIFQSFNLLSALTAQQNVAVPLIAAAWPLSKALTKSRELLARLGMSARRDHLPKNLSGGEKQRVAIARAMSNEANLLLADEPTANLDSKTGHEVTKLLCSIACEENKSVVIVSHDQRLRDVAMRIYTMEDGRIVTQEIGGHDKTCSMKKHRKGKATRTSKYLLRR
ncbi:ABC transporter ATP-binding protein [Candidatus Berkelbacteria bacterium]|nr:ABC transporter ATP-binding protein [Candidatus Berkelbacteria bacterium]